MPSKTTVCSDLRCGRRQARRLGIIRSHLTSISKAGSSVPTRSRNWGGNQESLPTPTRSRSQLGRNVAKYNSFVDLGKDQDFAKPTAKYIIQTSPFHGAWSMPILHEVLDVQGKVIAGLSRAGESAGGFALHDLPRVIVFGRITGRKGRWPRSTLQRLNAVWNGRGRGQAARVPDFQYPGSPRWAPGRCEPQLPPPA